MKRLEEEFGATYGARHCTASTSGTSAIHVAVGAIDPEPGDEIITAPITDARTVIPILAQNAIPVFADVERETFNLDPADVERASPPARGPSSRCTWGATPATWRPCWTSPGATSCA